MFEKLQTFATVRIRIRQRPSIVSSARAAAALQRRVHQGKDLSFNNIADADTAIECVRQFAAAACVIVKHANPCGVAIAATALEA